MITRQWLESALYATNYCGFRNQPPKVKVRMIEAAYTASMTHPYWKGRAQMTFVFRAPQYRAPDVSLSIDAPTRTEALALAHTYVKEKNTSTGFDLLGIA